MLSKPAGDEKISAGTFGYINARIRQRAYDVVIREFKKSGINQATLARRWGKSADVVSRFLSRPGNWEINTWTEALFAISGAVPTFGVAHVHAAVVAEPTRVKPSTSTASFTLRYENKFDPTVSTREMKEAA
jgi:hypothetical protein